MTDTEAKWVVFRGAKLPGKIDITVMGVETGDRDEILAKYKAEPVPDGAEVVIFSLDSSVSDFVEFKSFLSRCGVPDRLHGDVIQSLIHSVLLAIGECVSQADSCIGNNTTSPTEDAAPGAGIRCEVPEEDAEPEDETPDEVWAAFGYDAGTKELTVIGIFPYMSEERALERAAALVPSTNVLVAIEMQGDGPGEELLEFLKENGVPRAIHGAVLDHVNNTLEKVLKCLTLAKGDSAKFDTLMASADSVSTVAPVEEPDWLVVTFATATKEYKILSAGRSGTAAETRAWVDATVDNSVRVGMFDIMSCADLPAALSAFLGRCGMSDTQRDAAIIATARALLDDTGAARETRLNEPAGASREVV